MLQLQNMVYQSLIKNIDPGAHYWLPARDRFPVPQPCMNFMQRFLKLVGITCLMCAYACVCYLKFWGQTDLSSNSSPAICKLLEKNLSSPSFMTDKMRIIIVPSLSAIRSKIMTIKIYHCSWKCLIIFNYYSCYCSQSYIWFPERLKAKNPRYTVKF